MISFGLSIVKLGCFSSMEGLDRDQLWVIDS